MTNILYYKIFAENNFGGIDFCDSGCKNECRKNEKNIDQPQSENIVKMC